MAVCVVDLLEIVHVAEKQQERAGRAAATCQSLVEHACVEEAGEEVAFRKLAKLFHVAPVLVCEPADESAAGGVRDEADHGGIGEDLAGGHARRREDRERVERGGHAAAEQTEPCSARQREQRHGDVEEVTET